MMQQTGLLWATRNEQVNQQLRLSYLRPISDRLQSQIMRRQSVEAKPIDAIMRIKSNEELRSYLEDRPDLNLSLMREKGNSTLLHYAAFKNELPKMKIYILHFEAFCRQHAKHGRNEVGFQGQLRAWINVQNGQGLTALHYAGLQGNIEMIGFLERYGANMQAISKEDENILFLSVESKHIKTVVWLLQKRDGRIPFNINTPNHIGDTVLHKSAKHGYYNLTAYLMSREEAEINAKNKEGWTPLMYAVAGGHKEIVKLMLLKGVNRHAKNQEEKKAIDIAQQLGQREIARVLLDEFSNWEKVKIACNYKIVYRVEKPTILYCALFLFLFHLILLPTNLLAEVDILGNKSFFLFYVIIGIYWIIVLALFGLLTRKHPKRPAQDLQEVALPFCAECRHSLKGKEFHCFICGKCISRYDHHCPWINNCVSSFNIGKFTLLLVLLIIGCLQIVFISICLYVGATDKIQPSRFLNLGDQGDTYHLANMIVSSFFCFVCLFGLASLLGDQLKNLTTNTTSYERSRLRKKKKVGSLLTSKDRMSINNDDPNSSVSMLDEQEVDEPGCLSSCCSMLKQPYDEQA